MTNKEMIANIRAMIEKTKIIEEFCINSPKAAKQVIDYYSEVTLKLLEILESLL